MANGFPIAMAIPPILNLSESPSFAAGVSREVIQQGLDMLGWELDYAIEHTILGMREVAEEIGLK